MKSHLCWIPSLAVIIAGLTASGCTQARSCNAAYYASGVFLTIEPKRGPIPDGTYTLELEVDDEAEQLTFEVSPGVDLFCFPVMSCDQIEVTGSTSPYEVENLSLDDALQFSVVDRSRKTGPAALSIRLSRDGTVLLEESVEPRYTRDEPNGKGCGVQKTADVTLALD